MISVIIAVYNKANYIKKCIDSILNQTILPSEIIIIDDGSTDNSFDILNTFSNKKLIKVIKQKNLGPGKARNNGLEISTSKWVTFIDADDFWEHNFIETALKKMKNNTSCSVFLCGANWIGKNYNDVRLPIYSFEKNPEEAKWILPENLSAEDLINSMDFFSTGAVVAKRTTLINYGGYFDEVFCNSGEDGYLWIQVMFNEPIYRCLIPLVNINTMGSDLGINRKSLKPTPPALIYDQLLFKNIKKNRHNDLSSLLNLLAFRSFRLRLYDFQFFQSFGLLKKYPNLKKYKANDYPNIPFAFISIPINRCIIKPFLFIYRKLIHAK